MTQDCLTPTQQKNYIIFVPSGKAKPAKYVPPRTDAIFSNSSWVNLPTLILPLRVAGVTPNNLDNSAWEMPLKLQAIFIFCFNVILHRLLHIFYITNMICCQLYTIYTVYCIEEIKTISSMIDNIWYLPYTININQKEVTMDG